MKKYTLTFTLLLLGLISCLYAIDSDILWLKLDHGVYYADIEMPKPSFVGDSKIYVLRINPIPFKFEIHKADRAGKKRYSPEFWAKRENMVAVINACQLEPATQAPLGFLQMRRYTGNRILNPFMDMMLLLEPWEDSDDSFKFVLTSQDDYAKIKDKYRTAVQGNEIINNGEALPVGLDMTASFISVGSDTDGNMLFIFCRSPYKFNEIGELLLKLPLCIEDLMITEKGPQASLFFKNDTTRIRKVGSYEFGFYISDDNNEDPVVPFVLGIRRKTR